MRSESRLRRAARIQEAADRHAASTLADLEASLQETAIAILEDIGEPSHRARRID
jgi:hypothetical protein